MTLSASVAFFLVAGAGALPPVPAPPMNTATVVAKQETAPVGTVADDAADDPAIWRNPRVPARSLIVATDKKAGLYVYGMDGKVLHFVAGGRLNNVDLIDMGRTGVIVVASDRNDEAKALLQIYRLNTQSGELTALGSVTGGQGEAYGVCLMRSGRALDAFSVLKHGAIHRVSISFGKDAPSGRVVQSMQLATQTEGCVADSRTDTLYVGEEDRGIWAFDLGKKSDQPRLVAPVDGTHLVADVEGLALLPKGRRGGWLVASSQGDNAYALYRLPDMKPDGRFRIAAGQFGSTEETDGIALMPGRFGPGYPSGLFVAQDGDNAPAAQNFKFVSWRDVVKAIGTGK
jgi:3-phytase